MMVKSMNTKVPISPHIEELLFKKYRWGDFFCQTKNPSFTQLDELIIVENREYVVLLIFDELP